MIPKIIHQTAPKDKNEWHPIWQYCHNSWKKHFPDTEYIHILWTDEDIDSFIEKKYPEYFNYYQNLPFHIMKLDFARYCFLYTYGGIYADMDMYCYMNFFKNLQQDCYLIESPHENEIVQNSLMISSVKNPFYMFCIQNTVESFVPFCSEINYNTISDSNMWCPYVLENTGPKLLSKIYLNYKNISINLLPKEEYNAGINVYHKNIKTRHMMSGRWGKELMENLKERHLNGNMNHLSYRDYLIWDYKMFRGIDVYNFNFYESSTT